MNKFFKSIKDKLKNKDKDGKSSSGKSKAAEAAPKFVIESPEKPEFSIEHSDDDEDNIDVSEKLT